MLKSSEILTLFSFEVPWNGPPPVVSLHREPQIAPPIAPLAPLPSPRSHRPAPIAALRLPRSHRRAPILFCSWCRALAPGDSHPLSVPLLPGFSEVSLPQRRPGGPRSCPTPGEGPKGRAWGKRETSHRRLVEPMLWYRTRKNQKNSSCIPLIPSLFPR